MDLKYILLIIIFIYCFFILTSLIYFIYHYYVYKNYYLFKKKPLIIIAISFSAFFYNLSTLLILILKNRSIINFTRCINGWIISSMIVLKELKLYFNKNKLNRNCKSTKILYLIHSFLKIADIILLIYIINIFSIYYNNPFKDDSWQFYPLFVKYFFSMFIICPYINYCLYKRKINESLLSIIVSAIYFLLHILVCFVIKEQNNLKLILILGLCTTTFLIHIIYCVYPIVYIFRENNIKIISNKDSNWSFYNYNEYDEEYIQILKIIKDYNKIYDLQNNKKKIELYNFYENNKEIIKKYISDDLINRIETQITIITDKEDNIYEPLFKNVINIFKEKLFIKIYGNIISSS